jgi:hypothetical protein
LAPESTAYHIAQAVRVWGDLDSSALRRAFQRIMDRHPAARTTFSNHQGRPIQRAHDNLEVHFDERNAGGWPREMLVREVNEEAYRPFDLERGPLARVTLFRLSDNEGVLLLALHHIIADLWSVAVLLRELALLYPAERQGTVVPLPPLKRQYSDYVRWQADRLTGPDEERWLGYWQKKLGREHPALDLPVDRPRPPIQTFRGAAYSQPIGSELTAQLKTLGQAHEATLFMTLLAAFQVLLQRHTSQKEILVGCPTAGRTRREWADLMGYFANPVVLRTDFTEEPTFEELLAQVRQTVIGALFHSDYPFVRLVEKLRPKRDASRSPLFQAMFVLQNTAPLGNPRLASLALGVTGTRMDIGDFIWSHSRSSSGRRNSISRS